MGNRLWLVWFYAFIQVPRNQGLVSRQCNKVVLGPMISHRYVLVRFGYAGEPIAIVRIKGSSKLSATAHDMLYALGAIYIATQCSS